MIWGLDTSSRCTGWTAGTGETRPETGAWTYENVGTDVGLMLDLFHADLDALADRKPPTAIIFESPILTPFDTLLKLRKLYGMTGYVEIWARRWARRHNVHVIVQEEDLRTLKTRLTGSHKADKAEMVRMAKKCGITLPSGKEAEDAADSFACWLCAIQHHAKPFLPRWDALLYGSRGGLL